MTPFRLPLAALLVAGLCAPTPSPAAAMTAGAANTALQAPASQVLNGVVVDAAGNPVAAVPIALHRVVETGGAMVENVASDSAGQFSIRLREDEPTGALYFVAARYEGELFIGPTFRPPFPDGAQYVVQVGLDATSAARMARGVDPGDVFVRPPASPWRWGIAATVLVAVIGLVAVLIVRARGPDTRRRLLIRIAELDEERAAPRADGSAEGGNAAAVEAPARTSDEGEYRALRDDLLDRLRSSA